MKSCSFTYYSQKTAAYANAAALRSNEELHHFDFYTANAAGILELR